MILTGAVSEAPVALGNPRLGKSWLRIKMRGLLFPESCLDKTLALIHEKCKCCRLDRLGDRSMTHDFCWPRALESGDMLPTK
jgi:hypothetical protein